MSSNKPHHHRRRDFLKTKSGNEERVVFEEGNIGLNNRNRKRISAASANVMNPKTLEKFDKKKSKTLSGSRNLTTGFIINEKLKQQHVKQNGKTTTTTKTVGLIGRMPPRNWSWMRDEKPKQHHVKHNGKTFKKTTTSTDNRKKVGFVGSKKKLLATTTTTVEKPTKSKRVIRIDRHDLSNKRLNDYDHHIISNTGNSQVKKDVEEDNRGTEMSKNAQFRAIRPSSSILSFVDDNLLGRRREIEFRRAGYNTELPFPLDNIPFSTSSERERIEVPAFRNKLEFYAAAKISSSFPTPDLPEIAFAGRSNVGKSSLLNSLTRQWGIVRTSDKPGLTQSINFFNLGSKLSLVDLPGYGFAYAKDEVKEAWEELVKEYVTTRVGLRRVCLLVDTKWGMKPGDHELIDLMERSETKYQVVLTKTDLVFPIDVARRAMQIEENLKAKKSAVQPLMMVSSKTGAGIRSLRTALANIGRFVRL